MDYSPRVAHLMAEFLKLKPLDGVGLLLRGVQAGRLRLNPMERLQRSMDVVGGAKTEDVKQPGDQGIRVSWVELWGSARNPGIQHWN